jgi:hypothetical protein
MFGAARCWFPRSLVKCLLRELILIEDRPTIPDWTKGRQLQNDFGVGEKLERAKQLQTKWFESRQKLESSAKHILNASSAEWQIAREECLSTLESFRMVSDEITLSLHYKLWTI